MNKIFIRLRAWIVALQARPALPDPLDAMSLRERADLPPTHPLVDCR